MDVDKSAKELGFLWKKASLGVSSPSSDIYFKMIWHFLTCDAVWNLFDHLWTLLVHWKLAQKFSTHFIKSFKNVVPSTHAKTWLYFPLFFQTRSAKFPGYKESQLIKQQILRLFGSLPFGQLRVLAVAKGQKISEDILFLASNTPKHNEIFYKLLL